MKPVLLIVDDDEEIRSQMKWALVQDYEVVLAEDRSSAMVMARSKRPMVALLDLGLPPSPADPQEGLQTLGELLALDSMMKIIIVSGQNERSNALHAIGQGAYDFLSKPVEIGELSVVVRRAFHVAKLEREYRQLQEARGDTGFEGMLGSSAPMQVVFNQIRKVATAEAPVLILGESGTGKERVATAIHRLSGRNGGPFIAINCGAIPENLLESELFGHEKGSFTGAHATRVGRIEMANGGTLFLDELGELPLALQVKLLRFLQEGKIDRIGGRKEILVDTRVVAATNSDLPKAMSDGKFREDLYYRLAVVVIKLPPLRDRDNDRSVLAQAFLRRSADQNKRDHLTFDPEALLAIDRHLWPGNVREMENRVKRAVIMAEGRRISAADLELESTKSGREGAPASTSLKEARETLERELVQQALKRNSGKISPTATELGISRPTLYELMDKLGISREAARTSE